MIDRSNVMEKVRRSLSRAATPTQVPPPPALPDEIVRLVHSTVGLPELFAKQAAELKMVVTPVTSEEVIDQLLKFVLANPIRKIALSVSPIIEKFRVREALVAAGMTVKSWDEMTLDELYDYDCAITDVDYAVAESGTLVIKPTKNHGRGLTLVPMYHIALIEPTQFLPDLVDLFDKLRDDPNRSNAILISGPSKTADIEMNVVTGVHGPNVVNAFILQ
jgi:L-lactate utilization protein LutC